MMQLPSTDAAPPSSSSPRSFGLSAQDVARLISEDSPLTRIEVMERIAQEHGTGQFDPREQAIAQQIFRILMHDTEVKVRSALAQAVKDDSHISRDIILHMAQDVDDVSLPVIEHSAVFSEADLIGIVRANAESPRLIAVARRKQVPALVSSVLVDTGKPGVVSELVNNSGAAISEESYQTIVDTFPTHERIVTSLAGRDNLPVTVVEKLMHQASGKVGEELRQKYGLDGGQVKADTERTRELATLKLLEGNVSSAEIEKLVEQMHKFGRLTPSLLLTALCRGNLEFFEAVIARLAGIPTRNARMLVEDKGELGFKALYEKSKLPESLRQATRVVLSAVLQVKPEVGASGGRHFANRLVERVLSHTEGREIENLSYIIALIRQNNMH